MTFPVRLSVTHSSDSKIRTFTSGAAGGGRRAAGVPVNVKVVHITAGEMRDARSRYEIEDTINDQAVLVLVSYRKHLTSDEGVP
jgi:hypothetical protein